MKKRAGVRALFSVVWAGVWEGFDSVLLCSWGEWA